MTASGKLGWSLCENDEEDQSHTLPWKNQRKEAPSKITSCPLHCKFTQSPEASFRKKPFWAPCEFATGYSLSRKKKKPWGPSCWVGPASRSNSGGKAIKQKQGPVRPCCGITIHRITSKNIPPQTCPFLPKTRAPSKNKQAYGPENSRSQKTAHQTVAGPHHPSRAVQKWTHPSSPPTITSSPTEFSKIANGI